MGFAQEVKEELCRHLPESREAKRALCYGMLLFGKTFSPSEMLFQTEYGPACYSLRQLLEEEMGFPPLTVEESAAPGRQGKVLYSLRLPPEQAALLYHGLGHEEGEVSLRVRGASLEEEEGLLAFLKGVYLACGSLMNPERSYHLEFVVPYHNLSVDLMTLLGLLDFPAKRMLRKGNYVVYCKDSEAIEDFLTALGAVNSSLKLMRIKIYKDVRNNANRRTNFETANIDKTVNAAVSQIEDIQYVFERKGRQALEPELWEIGQARLDNPEMSLRELGESLEVPATRSAAHHRLAKISKLARKLRDEEGDGET